MTCHQSTRNFTSLPQRLGEVRWGLTTASINPPLNLPPIFGGSVNYQLPPVVGGQTPGQMET
jgi:hypothetical protein